MPATSGFESPTADNEKSIEAIDGAHSDSSRDYEAGSINEKALLRKLDLKLLPAVSLLYLLSFLDRSNVANARIEGLATDLHMTGNQYLTGLTLFFVGYVLLEVPWNIALKRTSPKIWLPSITIAWGIVATLQGITRNLAGFFVVRLFLGLAEGGLFPGVVYYFSQWYKRKERQYRIAMFFSMASLAGAFGGILAWGIAHMDGVAGQKGWRWIFILEGIATVLVAFAGYYFVSNYPHNSNFLSDDEKSCVHERLKADSDSTNDETFTWHNVSKALTDPKCWLYGLTFHTMSLPLYTLSLFLALATILTVAFAMISERAGRRAPFIVLSSSLAIIGYIILLTNPDPTHRPGVSYTGTFFAAAGIYPSTALVLSWPANNVSGQTKRATANAMQISIGNLGAVLGTQLYRPAWSPRYFVGHGMALAYMCANVVVVLLTWWFLSRENRKKELAEAQAGMQVVDDEEWHGDDDVRWRFTV